MTTEIKERPIMSAQLNSFLTYNPLQYQVVPPIPESPEEELPFHPNSGEEIFHENEGENEEHNSDDEEDSSDNEDEEGHKKSKLKKFRLKTGHALEKLKHPKFLHKKEEVQDPPGSPRRIYADQNTRFEEKFRASKIEKLSYEYICDLQSGDQMMRGYLYVCSESMYFCTEIKPSMLKVQIKWKNVLSMKKSGQGLFFYDKDGSLHAIYRFHVAHDLNNFYVDHAWAVVRHQWIESGVPQKILEEQRRQKIKDSVEKRPSPQFQNENEN